MTLPPDDRRVVDADDAAFRAFAAGPDPGPVVMLNLLRFREAAAYPDGTQPPEGVTTGREAYGAYVQHVVPLLEQVGAQVLAVHEAALAPLLAPEGERFDQAVLVRYPDRTAFLGMVTSAAYLEGVHHRTAALADSRLFPLAP